MIEWHYIQKPVIFGILSSGNLCLINHLILFWPHTASTAPDVQTCQLFGGKKSLNVHNVNYLIFFHGFLRFFWFLFVSTFKERQIIIPLVFCYFLLLEFSFLSFFYSEKPLWILTISIGGCWGCMRSKKY
jgi:hypothetical protein